MSNQRQAASRKLDRLYGKNVKCPYCRTKILKYSQVCEACGITKEQVAFASHQDAKKIMRGEMKGKVILTRRKPDDVDMVRFMIYLIFLGVFGAHNFFVGRKIRGWIMFCSFTLLILSSIIFTLNPDNLHPWRQFFLEANLWFPFDVPGYIAVIVWAYDWFAAVLLGTYKYPVHISSQDPGNKKEKENKK